MKRMIPLVACLLFSMANTCAQSVAQSSDPEGLKGLKSIAFQVVLDGGRVLDRVQASELQKVLQAEAEAKFAKAGIPILKWEVTALAAEPGSPRFIVNIRMRKANEGGWPVMTDSRLFQNARLSADPSVELSVSTWESHSVGAYPPSDLNLLHLQVDQEVDRFIRAYIEANPTTK